MKHKLGPRFIKYGKGNLFQIMEETNSQQGFIKWIIRNDGILRGCLAVPKLKNFMGSSYYRIELDYKFKI